MESIAEMLAKAEAPKGGGGVLEVKNHFGPEPWLP